MRAKHVRDGQSVKGQSLQQTMGTTHHPEAMLSRDIPSNMFMRSTITGNKTSSHAQHLVSGAPMKNTAGLRAQSRTRRAGTDTGWCNGSYVHLDAASIYRSRREQEAPRILCPRV